MAEDKKEEFSDNIEQEENKEKHPDITENLAEKEIKEEDSTIAETEQAKNVEKIGKELSELKDKYLRLYADFENYKRTVAKEKEELIKYSNEELMKELLTVIDHLELALQHSSHSGIPHVVSYNNKASTALTEGVEMTLKELKTTLEKFGLVSIEALGKPFDPFLHHAMAQIESEESEENKVVTEFRKGYMLRDRVLRAGLVGVSKKPPQKTKIQEAEEE